MCFIFLFAINSYLYHHRLIVSTIDLTIISITVSITFPSRLYVYKYTTSTTSLPFPPRLHHVSTCTPRLPRLYHIVCLRRVTTSTVSITSLPHHLHHLHQTIHYLKKIMRFTWTFTFASSFSTIKTMKRCNKTFGWCFIHTNKTNKKSSSK